MQKRDAEVSRNLREEVLRSSFEISVVTNFLLIGIV